MYVTQYIWWLLHFRRNFMGHFSSIPNYELFSEMKNIRELNEWWQNFSIACILEGQNLPFLFICFASIISLQNIHMDALGFVVIPLGFDFGNQNINI